MSDHDGRGMISFIIVTYNSEDYIDACLQSIQKEMSNQDHEIILIDNASSRRLPDLEGKYPHVTLIRNSLNRGFAVANNIGIQAARGDILWLLNPDTVLVEGCAKQAMICLKDNTVGITGNRLINPDGSLQKSVFENISVSRTAAEGLSP
jgi:GT2 family glycosyltransferase